MLAIRAATNTDFVRVWTDVILGFRGMSVGLISEDREPMRLSGFEDLDKIAGQLANEREQGVRMEAWSVATRLFNIDHGALLDGVKPVGNTFVSLTGYQARDWRAAPGLRVFGQQRRTAS